MNIRFYVKSLLILLVFLFGCSTTSDEPQKFKSIEDIQQARICVTLGTTQDKLATNELPEAEIIRVESGPDMFVALQQGRCDAIMIDNTLFEYVKHQYPAMVEIPSNYPTDDYGVGVSKNNPALHKQFNDFLTEIKDSGLYQEIYDRWILNGTESSMPDIQSYSEGVPLRVGITATQYPFAFMKEQDIVGLEIELIKRFAYAVQRPVELQLISFGSLIASLHSGKSDMIIASISITEERKKNVLFSDPYFETHTVIITTMHDKEEDKNANINSILQSWKDSFINNIIAEKRYMLILEGLLTTVTIAIFSILLGTLVGGIICFMRMQRNFWLRSIASTYISLIRGIPVLVLLMLMFYVFFAKSPINGVQVAIITFALNFSAYVSEMFRTAITSVDRGQTEAGIALGFSHVQTFYHIVMPQAIKNVLPVYKGEMISLIKMTSIVGYIAVEDLTKMSDIIRSRTFDAFFPLIMVAILYFLLAWIFGKLLDMLNSKYHS